MLQLHLDWNHVIGTYLLHLDDEERAMLPVVGTHALPISMVAESIAGMDDDAAQRSGTPVGRHLAARASGDR